MPEFLSTTLNRLRSADETPLPLPLAHLTLARWFESIIDQGYLKPHACKVFNRDLLYFSYGGVFYRAKTFQTQNASELPIAFVFDPTVLDSVDTLYPFDTGAMAEGKFGPEWTREFSSFRSHYRVALRRNALKVCDLVLHLFGSNRNYLRGEPAPSCATKPAPLPLLYRFLSTDLSPLGVDHRQRTIECLSTRTVRLSRTLIWIGFPDILGRDFIKLYRWTKPWVPEFFPYPYHRNFNPEQIAAILEQEAAKTIKRFVELP